MALTKKDKEEVKALIKEVLGKVPAATGTMAATLGLDQEPKTNCSHTWRTDGAYSDMLGVVVAPENLVVTLPDGTEKKYFTFDEAQEYTTKLPDGWRLPTRSEWCILAEEFGNNPETGKLDPALLMKNLNLSLDGYMDFDDNEVCSQASYGYLWSGTAGSAAGGYFLGFGSGSVFPAIYRSRFHGFPVRCIARG